MERCVLRSHARQGLVVVGHGSSRAHVHVRRAHDWGATPHHGRAAHHRRAAHHGRAVGRHDARAILTYKLGTGSPWKASVLYLPGTSAGPCLTCSPLAKQPKPIFLEGLEIQNPWQTPEKERPERHRAARAPKSGPRSQGAKASAVMCLNRPSLTDLLHPLAKKGPAKTDQSFPPQIPAVF